jgi:hypothetical protein
LKKIVKQSRSGSGTVSSAARARDGAQFDVRFEICNLLSLIRGFFPSQAGHGTENKKGLDPRPLSRMKKTLSRE